MNYGFIIRVWELSDVPTLVREQKTWLRTWKKSHFVFLTQNLKQLRLPRQKNSKSHCMQIEDLLCLLHLCYGISEAMLSYVKNKSNVVYLEIPDNVCDMRHIYRNSAQCCQLCKRQGLQWKTDCVPKTCSQNIPWSTALNLQFWFSTGVIWKIKLGAATQSMKTHPHKKTL